MPKEIEKRSEEQRKLQVTGGSTYILSLPKDWITKNQLKKGSLMVLCEEDDGSLSINPSKLEKQGQKNDAFIRVLANENPEAIMRKAISAYLAGFNILHMSVQGQQSLPVGLRNYLKTFARNYLVGTEIVTDSPAELTLQTMLNYPELSVQSALRRMVIIATSMHREAVGCLANLDYSAAKAVIETDREVNRFSLYIVRLLKQAVQNPRIVKEIGLAKPQECLGYRLITKSVERTADHATKIAENVLLLRRKLDENFKETIGRMSKLAITMFEDAMEALFKGDFGQAESVIEKIRHVVKLEKEAVIASHNVGIQETASLRLIIESVRRTAEYASDIAEIVLNLNIESVLDEHATTR